MELNIRKTNSEDLKTLNKWWEAWPDWQAPAKDFLPETALIVEKNNKPIMCGFLYLTNSKAVLLEWIVSDPDYRESDRKEILEFLITGCEHFCKELGYKYVFSIGRNQKLIDTHEKLGWNVDKTPSHELVKTL